MKTGEDAGMAMSWRWCCQRGEKQLNNGKQTALFPPSNDVVVWRQWQSKSRSRLHRGHF